MPAPPGPAAEEQSAAFGPWNPGISSRLPSAYLPLSTMFRPANVLTSVEAARELSDFTGMAPEDLVAVAPACLRHRIHLGFEGEAEGVSRDDLITEAVQAARHSVKGQ